MALKYALARETILEKAGDCVLYNGWPCLTCLSDAVSRKAITEEMVMEWWPEEHFDDDVFNPWDRVINFYYEMTKTNQATGYLTQNERKAEWLNR